MVIITTGNIIIIIIMVIITSTVFGKIMCREIIILYNDDNRNCNVDNDNHDYGKYEKIYN